MAAVGVGRPPNSVSLTEAQSVVRADRKLDQLRLDAMLQLAPLVPQVGSNGFPCLVWRGRDVPAVWRESVRSSNRAPRNYL